ARPTDRPAGPRPFDFRSFSTGNLVPRPRQKNRSRRGVSTARFELQEPHTKFGFVVKTGAMTFLEAALEVLKREGKPLHYKDLTERAMGKKLLTFVGRTPEVTMQTQLTAAVKKAPGSPFVRVKPGIFGLLRYPEMPPEPEAVAEPAKERAAGARGGSRSAADSA